MQKSLWSRAWRVWRLKFQPILLIVLLVTSFRSAVADWNDVPTGSMKPSILEGDRILVNKLAYGLKVPFTSVYLWHWDAPERGEIVVFNSPIDGTKLVKRIVGLPGDVLAMIENRLYINGEPTDYSELHSTAADQITHDDKIAHEFAVEQLGESTHAVMGTPQAPAMRSFDPVKIPDGEYFMMGDNRDNSSDSRYIGTVKLDQILGRTSVIAMSLDYVNHYLPRWERILKSID